jgi:hypothetical protein
MIRVLADHPEVSYTFTFANSTLVCQLSLTPSPGRKLVSEWLLVETCDRDSDSITEFRAAIDHFKAKRNEDPLVTRAFDMVGRRLLQEWNERARDLVRLRSLLQAYDELYVSLASIESRFIPTIDLDRLLFLKDEQDTSGMRHYVLCSKRLWSSVRKLTEEEWQILIERHLSAEARILARPVVNGFTNRLPIPTEVRNAVWRRDEGRCVRCGSRERLEFDHIIPVADGGSSTERNIELLCETCNRSKGRAL